MSTEGASLGWHTLRRCWPADARLDCLMFGGDKSLIEVVRRQVSTLPKGRNDSLPWTSDGYGCTIYPAANSIEEGIDIAGPPKLRIRNTVYFSGQLTPTAPWAAAKAIEAERQYHLPPTHFDCAEVGSLIINRGFDAAAGSALTQGVMR